MEIEEAVTVHFGDAKNVVEERILVRGVGNVGRVERHFVCSFEKSNSFVLFVDLYFFLEKAEEASSVLYEGRVRKSVFN